MASVAARLAPAGPLGPEIGGGHEDVENGILDDEIGVGIERGEWREGALDRLIGRRGLRRGAQIVSAEQSVAMIEAVPLADVEMDAAPFAPMEIELGQLGAREVGPWGKMIRQPRAMDEAERLDRSDVDIAELVDARLEIDDVLGAEARNRSRPDMVERCTGRQSWAQASGDARIFARPFGTVRHDLDHDGQPARRAVQRARPKRKRQPLPAPRVFPAMRAFLALPLALAGCQAPVREGPAASAERQGTREPVEAEARAPAPPERLPPLEPALVAAIAATAPYEVPGRPCLARPLPPGPGLKPERRRRQREIQSDSHWLNRHVRQLYSERLAYSGLDFRDGRFRHVVWLTGSERVPALRLGGRAADVPVEIVYGAPWSEAEIFRRRGIGNPVMTRLIPDAQGEGHMQFVEAGWVNLDVHSPTGEAREDVLAHCDALRRAYRLPVLISFNSGRIIID